MLKASAHENVTEFIEYTFSDSKLPGGYMLHSASQTIHTGTFRENLNWLLRKLIINNKKSLPSLLALDQSVIKKISAK